ncbi:MAG: type I methionyl aminopeptidase [Deltaproteobacteria bacterium]|nr:type I methionyl aminopeptidase [Deltaproteobacteria bacterium]MBW2122308.1 type I methionyl aminopeptidase [Deltaproteobacteria bacterium]
MIQIKSRDEIAILRKSNRIVARVLRHLKEITSPGRTGTDLDRIAERMIHGMGGVPAFKGYRGYPANICVSVNEQVVHGIPDSRVFEEGDIVSLDLGVIYRGYVGDAAITFPVGTVDPESNRLLEVTETALMKGIEQAREGNRLFDISHAIQSHVEANGFSVVRDFTGHGIGRQMHEDPQIPNFGRAGTGDRLRAGMVLALEPMVNAGDWRVRVLDNGWTVVTADGKRSAHFEHSIAITDGEPEILSLP